MNLEITYSLSCFDTPSLAFQVVRRTTGKCHETMTRQFWYVRDFIGQRAQVKLVDFSSRGWGHINFDDLEGDITCSNLENTGIYLA